MSNNILWSDERIRDRYYALVPCEANMGEMEYWNTLRDVGERVSYELRNEYEAQLSNQYQRIERFVELVDQLEAQLAQTWEPLPDGQYERPNRNHKGTNTLSVFANGAELETWHSDDKYQVDEISLPDNIRLCRLVTQEPTHE